MICSPATLTALALLGVRLSFVDATFNADSNANLAVYYGQNSKNIVGAQANLAYYCQGNRSKMSQADNQIRL
jgi:hypothetical protein